MADTIYHVAPITPNARFKAVAADDPGRAFMLSYYRPDQTQLVCDRAAFIAAGGGGHRQERDSEKQFSHVVIPSSAARAENEWMRFWLIFSPKSNLVL